MAGFNAMFAVSSIPMEMKYYTEFKKQLVESHLSVTPQMRMPPEDVLQEEDFDTDALDQTSRDFLESAIQDYNAAFNTNFDTSSDKFQNYYKSVKVDKYKTNEQRFAIIRSFWITYEFKMNNSPVSVSIENCYARFKNRDGKITFDSATARWQSGKCSYVKISYKLK